MTGERRLSRRLTLEAPVRTPDGAGGYTESWQALGTLWAEAVPGSGSGEAMAGQDVAAVAWRITVRAAPEGAPSRPAPGQRFRMGGRRFAILAVAEADPRAHYLNCFSREEVSR